MRHAFESEPDPTMLAAIQENLKTGIQSRKEKRAKLIRFTRRLAAAAVFVVCVSGIAWWWLRNSKPAQTEVAQEKNDKQDQYPDSRW